MMSLLFFIVGVRTAASLTVGRASITRLQKLEANFIGGFDYVGCLSSSQVPFRYEYAGQVDTPEDMTPSVCDKFCRTLDVARFFALHDGKDCSCWPFIHDFSKDEGLCAVPCNGDSATICGGSERVSVYSMRRCSDFSGEPGPCTEQTTTAENTFTHGALS